MKRLPFLIALAGLSACGDNTPKNRICGEGTVEEAGVCVPTGPGTPTCTDGTILDTQSNSCVIDPNACQDGTVLIGNQCVDPTDGLTVDVTEAVEPNGAGVVESSTTPAGELTLKPIGQKLIIKGNTNPFRDDDADGQLDADFDTYFVEITAPTLLQISTDGVGGTASGFLVLPVQASNPLTDRDWIRYGLNVTGDMSKRQVYIPEPGVYALTFADVRSMYLDGGSPPVAGLGGAAGSPEAFYYATIEQLAIPAATALTLTNGTATATGTTDGTIHFYTTTMGTGLANIVLEGDNLGTENALVLQRNNAFKETAAAPADILALGFRPADTTLIVADYTYHYAPGPQPYTLTVRSNNAVALADGATAPVVGTDDEDFFNFSIFYYDLDASDAITGMNIQWNQPVTGFIADENTFFDARFTGGDASRTFTTYNGLIRHRETGRHYFMVLAPDAAVGDDIIATEGDVVRKTPTVITRGTPLTGATIDPAFKSTSFTYAPESGVDRWQQFLVSGTATGTVNVRYFDAESSYGRLDAVTTVGGAASVDNSAAFTHSFAAGATTARGRVMAEDTVATYLVIATPATNTGATVDIDFKRRDNYADVMLTAGTPVVLNDQTIAANGGVQRYLVRTAVENKIDIALTPDGTELDAVILSLTRAEDDVYDGIDYVGAGEAEAGAVRPVNTWTALEVSGYDDLDTAETFDITFDAIPPFYTVTSGTTAFADACTGGTVHTFVADGVTYPADDDGTTAAITLPVGFEFFGNAVSDIYVASNGWLSFDAIDDSFFSGDIPDPDDFNNIVAPYFTDLGDVVLCTKTVGTKFVVQWTGGEFDLFGTLPVQFQAIFDTATDTLEFVYGPEQDIYADGTFSVIGVENQDGSDGQVSTATVAPNTSRLLTPMP
ncbi:MAG: hypothetical protein SFX73_09145 [Kofleriaceae bacterium]|nr:hypothetical protein [Kofleriaceae bacterium]